MKAALTILLLSITIGGVHLVSWMTNAGIPLLVSQENAVIFAFGLVMGSIFVPFSVNAFSAIQMASKASSEEEFEAQVVPALEGDAVSPKVVSWFVWPVRIAVGAAIGLVLARVIFGFTTTEPKANKTSILTPDPLRVETFMTFQSSTQKSECAPGQA